MGVDLRQSNNLLLQATFVPTLVGERIYQEEQCDRTALLLCGTGDAKTDEVGRNSTVLPAARRRTTTRRNVDPGTAT